MRIKKYNIRKHCDLLWSELVKLRAGGKCEKCGKTEQLQSHHIVPRTDWNLRFDELNGVCLCFRDHFYWAHKDMLGFGKWFVEKFPGRGERLELRRRQKGKPGKQDYTLLRIYLESEIKKFK